MCKNLSLKNSFSHSLRCKTSQEISIFSIKANMQVMVWSIDKESKRKNLFNTADANLPILWERFKKIFLIKKISEKKDF